MIPNDFRAAHEAVINLVETFSASFDKYHEANYNETAVRNDFLNKFFIALGWDVNHETQTNPYAQEVKVERSVKVAARVKKADYAFFIEPNFETERFFVEAKRPSASLETPDNCFQTIRYAYSSSRAALSLLTNFKEFIVMDCRYEPDITNAANQVHKKFYFEDFKDAQVFGEIYYLFGRDAVADGELDRYAEKLPKPKGKVKQRKLFSDGFREVDESFLEKLETYRADLAQMFKRENPALNSEDLTEATQRTLDRLVFIRFLEDKMIEPNTILDKFGDKPHAWKQFVAKSKEFDKSYNGIIFKSHPVIDTDDFKVDDTVFLNICEDFASAYSPYHFNYIPIHILGSIYERFLGNVIEVKGKNAEVVEKPEVKKANGVFYTPKYIVDYIVENTIGKLVEKKTPKDVEEMRFADIACGSGSFLLGVYDYLLRWHTRYYNQPKNKPEAKRAGCIAHEDGTFHLSFGQKKEILTNNIYGTDIDRQAHEVTQLSLFLKLLEEETQGTKQMYLTGVRQTMLPSLADNIQCGNALVDWDVTGGDLFEQLDYEKERRLNPMSFKQKFPEVMNNGGFDAIVGNPPYVRPHNIDIVDKEYYWKKYESFTHKSDLYSCFIEKGTELLKEEGYFGYIVSHGWLNLNSFQNLRKLILDNYKVIQLVELPYKVFANADVMTGIFIFQRYSDEKRFTTKINVIEGNPSQQFKLLRTIPQRNFLQTYENVFDLSITPVTEAVKNKMRKGNTIGSLFDIRFGLKTGDDEMFLHKTRKLHKEDKPLLRGEDVKRYSYEYKGEYVWYVPIEMRNHRKTARPGEPERFEQPKVLVKDTTTDFAGTFDNQNYYVKDVLIVTPKKNISDNFDLKFLLGLINSRALRFYYRTTFKTLHVQSGELGSLPLPNIKLKNNPKEKAMHDALVKAVEQIMQAKERSAEAKNDGERDFWRNKCDVLENSIDETVFDLYDLSREERDLIKNA